MTAAVTASPGWPDALRARPVCPRRQLPVPFVNEIAPDGTGLFAILDVARQADCYAGRLCAMCGAAMGEEIAFVGDQASLLPGSCWVEPPVCEPCAELALAGEDPDDGRGGLCPYLSRERVPRRPLPEDASVLGSPDGLDQIGRTVAKRPVIIAVTRSYEALQGTSHAGSPKIVYQSGRPVRVRTFAYRGGVACELPVPAWWPQAVRCRPVCPKRLLPIPFSALVNEDGTANFSVGDQERTIQCAQLRLCGVCGGPLGRGEVAFLGGPASADPERGAYTDPPMHEACAEASMALCPHIARPGVPRRTPPVDVLTADPAGFTEDKPGSWVMVITDGFRAGFAPTPNGPALVFRPGRQLRRRTFGYGPGGALTETTPPPKVITVVRNQPRRRPRSRR